MSHHRKTERRKEAHRPKVLAADDRIHGKRCFLYVQRVRVSGGEGSTARRATYDDSRSVLITLVLGQGILRSLDILHHTLCALGERRASLDLELGEHVALGVVRDGARRDEPFGEMRVVVLLEVILLDEEAEEGNGLVENVVDFDLGFLAKVRRVSVVRLAEQRSPLTPLSPFLRFSSMKSEMYSGDLVFWLTKTEKAYWWSED